MHLPHAAVAAEQKQAWQVISGRRTMPRRAIPRGWWLGLAGLVLATLVLYVHTVTVEFKLEQQQKQLRVEKEKMIAERVVLAQSESPLRVQELAEKQGMGQPKEVVFMAKASHVQAPPANVIPPPTAVIHEGF